ncbi:Phosphoenolpyruvate carboxylase [archaeon HR06]|nr:Phosphoenolpyruvate carboxylase [archaeon HR06]
MIPKTMSTQHPDNATIPSWCKRELIEGEDEIYEAYFAFKDLNCQEVMWDSEGKDVDTKVVRKLLEKYPEFFKEKVIGEDIRLTYRIPNPRVEEAEKKYLLETLFNIPLQYDIATIFYGRKVIPIFEVILPLTTSSKEIIWLSKLYSKMIGSLEDLELDSQTKAKEWVGEIEPKRINVIPLVEDYQSLIEVRSIVEPYLEILSPKTIRVFLARSDPALNYGLIPAVLLVKIALSELKKLSETTGIKIYPILGAGALPFRGNLNPKNLEKFLEEYKGIYTITIQSALKYDYDLETSRNFIKELNERLPAGEARVIENKDLLIKVIDKFIERYNFWIEKIAPLVNSLALYVPERRTRKLHIGLFGYSRRVGKVSLPRAIPFVASLYSLGLPPELISLDVLRDLKEEDYNLIMENYKNFREDLSFSCKYFSWRAIDLLRNSSETYKLLGINKETLLSFLDYMESLASFSELNLGIKVGARDLREIKHENLINNLIISLFEGKKEEVKKNLVEAGKVRRSLG